MKAFAALVVIIVLILPGCRDTHINKQETRTLLTAHRDPTINFSELDHWIILHNNKGDLLGFTKFGTNGEASITSDQETPGDVMTVTQLWVYANHYTLASYFGIPVGTDWNLNSNFSADRVDVGTFDITLQNVPDLSDYRVSTLQGNASYHVSTDNSVISSYTYDGESHFLLALTDIDGNLKYKRFDDPQAGQDYTYDYSTLDAADKSVTFHFPPTDSYYLSVNAYDDEDDPNATQGYTLRNAFSTAGSFQNSLKSGYPTRFSQCRTIFLTTVNHVTYGYTNRLHAPSGDITISAESPPFTVQDTSRENFSLTTTLPFGLRQTDWITREGDIPWTSWSVFSDAASQSFDVKFPDDIINQYPGMKLHDIYYSGTTIHTQTRPYKDVMGDFFNTGKVPIGDEYRSYYVPGH